MKLKFLKEERIEDFVSYCKKYKGEIDESFLYDEDLKKFKPNEENPTYIVTNEKGDIVATASLIIDDYNKRGKKARFRILHSKVDNLEYYNMLMTAILKHTKGLDKVFIFIPIVNKGLIDIIEKLDFNVERHSFFLVRENQELEEHQLPKDYYVKSFRPGIDEEIYCVIRNRSFANLKGSETSITLEMAEKIASSDEYIEGGLMILYHKDKPVGVVRGSKDEYEDLPVMNIGPLAIIPEYQGKGLGRILLRKSLQFAKENGYDRTVLCVNGENERAKALYIQEGFKEAEAVTCYKYDLK